jgi:hypothetical protein
MKFIVVGMITSKKLGEIWIYVGLDILMVMFLENVGMRNTKFVVVKMIID